MVQKATKAPASSPKTQYRVELEANVVLDERVHWNLPQPTALHDNGQIEAPDAADSVLQPLPEKRAKPKVPLGTRIAAFLRRQLAQETAKGTSFVLIPVCFGGGSLAYWALPVEPALHNIAFGIVAMCALVLVSKKMMAPALVRMALVACLVALTGMGAAQWRTISVDTHMVGGGVTTIITGRIARIEIRPDNSARMTIDVLQTDKPTLTYAPERVRLTMRNPLQDARAGAIIEGRASLRAASGPFRPGGFDFAFHAYFQRIGAYGFFLGVPSLVDAPPVSMDPTITQRMSDVVANGRQWLGKRVRAVDEGSPQAAVAAALITGEKTPIPEDDAEVLRLSGLAHILSISGLHMALVAGTMMGAVRAIIALSPEFSARWPVKKYAAATALITVAGYLFVAGASVATQRSFLMLSIMLGAVLIDRAAVTIRNLALAALVVLLIAPETIAGPSFQMSFAATASLIALYSGWSAQRLHQDPQRSGWDIINVARQSGGYVAGLAMTSIVAGAATGLYAVYHFHRIATLGLIANLLAVPIVSIVTMPLAIIGVIAIPFGLDGFVYAAMIASVEAVMAVARRVVAVSPGAVVGEIPLAGMLLGTLALLCLTLLRSQFRWLGVPVAAIALWVSQGQATPLALISEDARQMALIRSNENGRSMAVNRARPNGFTMEQWQPAFKIEAVMKPEKVETIAGPPAGNAMVCDARICVGRLHEGREDEASPMLASGQEVDEPHGRVFDKRPIAYLAKRPLRQDRAAWTALCSQHSVIVHAYAPSRVQCRNGTLEVTAQTLALQGAAALYRDERTGELIWRHAIGEHLRPWHRQRQFSRAARNLSPYYSPPKSNVTSESTND